MYVLIYGRIMNVGLVTLVAGALTASGTVVEEDDSGKEASIAATAVERQLAPDHHLPVAIATQESRHLAELTG